jgi:starch synthase
MFFSRGVLETVKKLGWQPDVIHCHGWMTGIMALYIKHVYNKDPHFKNTKVVISLYNDEFAAPWDKRFHEKLAFEGFPKEISNKLLDPTHENIMKVFAEYADGINIACENLAPNLKAIFDETNTLKLDYIPEENQGKELSAFFDKVIEESVLA